jgi:hypothetical protein
MVSTVKLARASAGLLDDDSTPEARDLAFDIIESAGIVDFIDDARQGGGDVRALAAVLWTAAVLKRDHQVLAERFELDPAALRGVAAEVANDLESGRGLSAARSAGQFLSFLIAVLATAVAQDPSQRESLQSTITELTGDLEALLGRFGDELLGGDA